MRVIKTVETNRILLFLSHYRVLVLKRRYIMCVINYHQNISFRSYDNNILTNSFGTVRRRRDNIISLLDSLRRRYKQSVKQSLLKQ